MFGFKQKNRLLVRAVFTAATMTASHGPRKGSGPRKPLRCRLFAKLLLGVMLCLLGRTSLAQQPPAANAQLQPERSSGALESDEVIVARLQKKAEAVVAGVQKELDKETLRKDVIERVQRLDPLMQKRKYHGAVGGSIWRGRVPVCQLGACDHSQRESDFSGKYGLVTRFGGYTLIQTRKTGKRNKHSAPGV